MISRRQMLMMLDSYKQHMIVGNPVLFNTNISKPLKQLLVPFVPVQEGSGDPSPSNVRNIIGWTGVNISHCGKNVLNSSTMENYAITVDGTLGDDVNFVHSGLIKVSVGSEYAYSFDYNRVGNRRIHAYDENGNWVRQITSVNYQATVDGSRKQISFSTQQGETFVKISTAALDTRLMVELGSTASEYEPYITGKNFCPQQSAKTVSSGNMNLANTGKFGNIVSGVTYTLSFDVLESNSYRVQLRINDSRYIQWDSGELPSNQRKVVTFTASENGYINFWAYSGAYPANTKVFDNIQLELGSTATEYEKYSDGQYPVVFPAVGKNLFDVDAGETGRINTSGEEVSNTAYYRSDFILIEPNTKYTLSASGASAIKMYFYTEDKVFISPQADTSSSSLTETSPSSAKYARINIYKSSVTLTKEEVELLNVQFEKGSSATSYEPYTNTVYGGTLDVTTGVLTATHVKHKVSDFSWQYIVASSANVFSVNGNNFPADMKKRGEVISDSFKTIEPLTSWGLYANADDFSISQYAPSDNKRLAIKDMTYNNASDFKSARGDAEIVYELAEPLEFNISDINVPVTLIGDNTIWSDTNSENTVTCLKKG